MLAQTVESYLAVRRACGFELKTQGNFLRSFASYSDDRGKHYVCSEVAIEWAGLGPSVHQCARRLGQVIRFARYARLEDQSHELPPAVFGKENRPRPIPYIFSQDNIQRLVQAASELGCHSFRRKTYSTLFALLACTGLRVSEAIMLRFEDITPDGLVVRRTKFRKSRLVPLHETARIGLECYLEHRRLYAPFDDHVFVSLRRKPLLPADVRTAFRSTADKIGLQCVLGQPRPTPHSLRHTFTVRALEACSFDRDNITKHMLALSTYLGHSKVSATYWYMEATPDLMKSIAERFANFVKGGPTMTPIAPHITSFLQQRLPIERRVSDNTCESYAYAFKLLFEYASACLKISPSELHFEQLDASLILNFLNHLETVRGNGPNSRNTRLATIKSFMHFMEYRVPTALDQIRRVLAIPTKKADTRLVRHLTVEEMQAIMDTPDPTRRDGIRDRAMIYLCFAGGLRVSELIGLLLDDLKLQPNASILIRGKGRRERCLPLWKETISVLRAWLAVRGKVLVPELFINAHGQPMTRSGFEYILRKHTRIAEKNCSSLSTKRVSPHVLRHTCALTVLQATKDLRKVALWLGHANIQTTEIYTRADPSVKLEALDSIVPPKLRSGRFKATDKLIASLKAGTFMRSKIAPI